MYEILDVRLQKTVYYYFKKGRLLDYKGWFTEEEVEEAELIGFESTRSDYILTNLDIFSSKYYEVNLYFDKIIETYHRRYMK